MVLYIERWLKAPVQEEDGQLVQREKGTPQGGVISPLLANLFLHYAFDRWMAKRSIRKLPFERYADDAIVHCRTEGEAQEVRAAIAARLQECGLELHPEKTKIVYCKDDDRRRTYPNEKFDFLGYTFRPRRSKNRKGKYFINFSPAVSDKAVKAIRAEIRSWNLPSSAVTSRSKICPGCSIRSSEVGSNITGGIIARRSIRRCVNWIVAWPVGPIGNTRSCAVICAGRHIGSRVSRRRDPKLFAHWQMGVRRGSMVGAV